MIRNKLSKFNKYHYISIAGIIALAVVGTLVLSSSRAQSDVYSLDITGLSVSGVNHEYQTKRVTVNLIVKNNAKDILQVSPGLQMFLRTSSGKTYNMTAKYLEANTTIGGPLKTDKSMSLAVDYDIPEEEKPETFIYQPDAVIPVKEVGL